MSIQYTPRPETLRTVTLAPDEIAIAKEIIAHAEIEAEVYHSLSNNQGHSEADRARWELHERMQRLIALKFRELIDVSE